MLWTYALAFGGLTAVLALIFCLFNDSKKILGPLISGFVFGTLVNAALVYLATPYFTFWSVGGFSLLLFVDIVIAGIITFIAGSENEEMGGLSAAGITLVVLLIVWALVTGLTTPTVLCDNNGYQKMVSLLNLQEEDAVHPDTDLASLIRVSPDMALAKASNALSQGDAGGAAYGSYLAPNRAYLQKVQDHWYYIVDLSVTDWRGFRNRGAVVPGYIVIDAMNPQAAATLRTGYNILYAPYARFNKDLDRHVYLNFSLGTRYQVQDLTGMEVDDEWNPYYTGTLVLQSVGFQGKTVAGVITVNPQTGEILKYGLEDSPEWVDRIYPLGLVESYAKWWGDYHAFQACTWQGNAGRVQIDAANDVVTSQGLEFQITMTSKMTVSSGSDYSLTEIIYVNPKTGEARRQDMSGAIVEKVDDLVDEASFEVVAGGYEPQECELHTILGTQVWYCILTGRTETESGTASSGSYTGVAFITAEATAANDVTAVIIDETLEGAYRQLRTQLASRATDDPTLAGQTLTVQIEGIIQRKSVVPPLYESTGTDWYLFTIVEGTGKTWFAVSEGSLWNAAYAEEGDKVTITAIQEPEQPYMILQYITVEGIPDFDSNK